MNYLRERGQFTLGLGSWIFFYLYIPCFCRSVLIIHFV